MVDDTRMGRLVSGTRAPVINLLPRPITTVNLLGLASSPLRGLHAGVRADRHRRQLETARQAHERALSCWSFDGEREMWIPDLLRR
jgi:hypothetical protein